MMDQTYAIPLLLLFLVFLLIFKHFKAPKCNTLPPGPKPWPILGNILQIGKNPHVALSKFAESYGPLISLRLGTQILIVGSSPHAAEEIFKTQDRVLSGRQVLHATPNKRPELNYLSVAWAFECNDQWKFLRTLFKTELFSGKSMEFQASLQACVKEALRLHPPGPLLLPHRALESCKVMGYTIPKDSQVMVNVWAIGRDPKIWEDPLAFKPDRFLNSELDFKGNDFEYIPFGAGRRMCPGLPMATKHVPLILASLIHCFDWSLPFGKDPTELDMTEKLDITLLKERALALVPNLG